LSAPVQKGYLLSALGDPRAFENEVRKLGVTIVHHSIKRDHHNWTHQELETIEKEAFRQGAVVLASEKDAVKIAGRISFVTVGLELECVEGKKTWNERIWGHP
jgi:tetraacyldisaccharide-1-P 4'-kinase